VSRLGESWLDEGTLALTRSFPPGPTGSTAMLGKPGPQGTASVDAEGIVGSTLARWIDEIDKLVLRPPGRDRGALWCKLGAKSPTDPGYAPGGDDASIEADELALRLAQQEGKYTLEALLQPSGFQQRFQAELAQLKRRIGRTVLWKEFGLPVWERISVKYVGVLEGRVTVYVDSDVLADALKQGRTPILSRELRELEERRRQGSGITEIVVKDIYDGTGMAV
jgi:hypothetical protein